MVCRKHGKLIRLANLVNCYTLSENIGKSRGFAKDCVCVNLCVKCATMPRTSGWHIHGISTWSKELKLYFAPNVN